MRCCPPACRARSRRETASPCCVCRPRRPAGRAFSTNSPTRRRGPRSLGSPGGTASRTSPSSWQRMPPTVRLFVAINLPEDVRRGLHEAAAPLRSAAPQVSWVAAEKLHLTMKFLGEQPPETLETGEAALRAAAAGHRAFDIEIGGFGAFPSLAAPSVVWAGVAVEPRLELLQHDM